MIDFHPTTVRCDRCSASAWERIENVGREDVVECCFCGVIERVKAAAVPAAARQHDGSSEFRFQFGRFKGLTFAEADREKNGRAYLEHLRDTNEKLRDRIAEYLTQTGLDAVATDGEIVHLCKLLGATDCPASQPSSPRLFG